MPDKLNRVDYRWYVVRTRPHQEVRVASLLESLKSEKGNILEVYAPTHTTVGVRSAGVESRRPLFAGLVFVLATQQALSDFMREHAVEGSLQYERRRGTGERTRVRVIPEDQMRAFRDFNENYADKVIVLERPYTDYAFNAKSGEANEIVRVVDGPLAGCTGYVCRFRRERRLVFQVQGTEPGSRLTVSFPNAWDLHVVRLHNTECDRQSSGTEKGRAWDLLAGILQGCGYGSRSCGLLYGIIGRLAERPSLVSLCNDLYRRGETVLGRRLARLTGEEAELVINLARYEHDNPGYVRRTWRSLTLRPFLTPTPGAELEEGAEEMELRHEDFTEIIRRVRITEETYDPVSQKAGRATTVYYAHIGVRPAEGQEGYLTLFANWDGFLSEYFLTAGKANEKLVGGTVQSVREGTAEERKRERLVESFHNFAPGLYKVLASSGSAVKAVRGFSAGRSTLDVMALTVPAAEAARACDELIGTCTDICRELNATAHLAVWRRCLRTVWLHV